MTFLGFVCKNLTRRPLRTSLTLLALATAIGSVMALSGVADGFTRSFREVYQSHRVDVVVTREGAADRLSSSLPDRFVDIVAASAGVDRVAGVLLETLSLDDRQIYGVPAMGMPVDSWLFADYEMTGAATAIPEGRGNPQPSKNPAAGDTEVVYVGQNVAQRANLSVGDTVTIFDETLVVAGIFATPSVFENGSMILPLKTLQRLTGREDQITYINVAVAASLNSSQVKDVTKTIESMDPKLLALATEEFVQTDARMQMAGAMAWMTSAIALLVGGIGTLNTMMTSVLERTGEIGILRAVGWPVRRIATVILLESVLLSLAATVIGGVSAAGLLWLLSQSEAVAGLLRPTLSPAIWCLGLAVGLGIGVVGAFLPAYRASQMRPTEALRSI